MICFGMRIPRDKKEQFGNNISLIMLRLLVPNLRKPTKVYFSFPLYVDYELPKDSFTMSGFMDPPISRIFVSDVAEDTTFWMNLYLQ